MACLKLSILDEQYKRTELKVSYFKKELTSNFCAENVRSSSFNSKEMDSETGMFYYSARYYNPPTFISRDPLFEKYHFFSPYAMTFNNPLRWIDMTGMEPEEAEPPVRTLPVAVIKADRIQPQKPASTGSRVVTAVKNTANKTWGVVKKINEEGGSGGALTGRSNSDLENKITDAIGSVLQGLALFIPPVALTNDVMTITGEDIYNNEATTGDKILSGADIVTFGVAKRLKYIANGIKGTNAAKAAKVTKGAKVTSNANTATTAISAGSTIYKEQGKKQEVKK
jgi:RHS repeat-associated protein